MQTAPKTTETLVAAFYEFFELSEPAVLREWLQTAGDRAAVQGTVLLATEGINGTLAGNAEPLRSMLEELRAVAEISLANVKFSTAPQPFRRFRVRIKPEIVTFRQDDPDPRKQVGQYVAPSAWDTLIQRNDVRLIDTRNDYEVAIGTFRGAEDPQTENFTDFAQYVEDHLDPEQDKKIAMFCTGGIRCEKATSYLLAKGFQEVFHLEGGILGYLAEIAPDASSWQGECYVFDERVSVNHALQPGAFRNCTACGWPAQRRTDCPKCKTS